MDLNSYTKFEERVNRVCCTSFLQIHFKREEICPKADGLSVKALVWNVFLSLSQVSFTKNAI